MTLDINEAKNILKENMDELVKNPLVIVDEILVKANDIAIKSLETIQRIDDVLNVEGMTEIDVLDEIMEAVSEFKYDCEVSE